MFLFAIAFLAGVLTVLAPCILPFLPIIIGASNDNSKKISLKAISIILSLAFSVILFTILLKATTLFINIPMIFWTYFSGIVVIFVGLFLIFPKLWLYIPYINKLNIYSNKLLTVGENKKSILGDIIIGFSLGPIFTTCSPIYFYIIGVILPLNFLLGLIYLISFTIGVSVSLFLIAIFGNGLVSKLNKEYLKTDKIKKILGLLILLIGISIFTGFDKKIETYILDNGYNATINFEDKLLEKVKKENNNKKIMNNNLKIENKNNIETITLAGGCFWCTEAFYQNKKGIIDAVSGYAGGDEKDADYNTVSEGNTKHRESVQITFDKSMISLDEIFSIYWSHIDPTDKEGQFADKGYQYQTAIYYHDENQKNKAIESKQKLIDSKLFDKNIVTEILPFVAFFKAEEYHQDYFEKSSNYYENYKKASGRQDFIDENWAKNEAKKFLKNDYKYTDEEIAEKLKNLDPLAYHVVAENGTESPFSNKYWDNKAEGIYVDIVTNKPLFSSTHKYDSGTGWPSFWRTIDDNSVTLHEDNTLSTTRVEVRSEVGHIGHVFDDGPVNKGGKRFCTNSASLLFIPKNDMKNKGYEKYLYLFE